MKEEGFFWQGVIEASALIAFIMTIAIWADYLGSN